MIEFKGMNLPADRKQYKILYKISAFKLSPQNYFRKTNTL